MVMACSSGFSRRSVGYVGASDGWRDLRNFKMDWEFRGAPDGNIAMMGEIDPQRGEEFTVAISFGQSFASTAAKLLGALAEPFPIQRAAYVRQWQRTLSDEQHLYNDDTGDDGAMHRLSRCVLLAHEDKVFSGAMVASMSIPWGETKGDDDIGGYHLVWTRDLAQSATALLSSGQTATPRAALIWLAVVQRPDGSFPQNSWIDGRMYWPGLQLDEVAAPILLAWRLRREGVPFGQLDPCPIICSAAGYLMLQGPVTMQERWEENAGYSPSTLAAVITGFVCAADFAHASANKEFLLAYADWLASHIEDWTVTTRGELVPGISRHYIRITTTDPQNPDPEADPDSAMIQVANGGGLHPARNVVGGDFLQLVRYGIRAADDPIVRASVEVIDRVLKRDLPQGPCWLRYNHDGYGQKDDGSAFDGTGVGRAWPLLTGERGHYELAAGRDPMPYIQAMENFANEGGMLAEQLWDGADISRIKRGAPTGAAMPLCWAHAEYLSLVRSRHDNVCFDRVASAHERYVAKPVKSQYEFWTMRHRLRRLPRGKILRIVLAQPALVAWTADNWATANRTETRRNETFRLSYIDFPSADMTPGAVLEFTFFWLTAGQWQGKNWTVAIQ